MKHPIVNDLNVYSSPSKVESLKQALEAKIRGKVQKWRPHAKTIWNRWIVQFCLNAESHIQFVHAKSMLQLYRWHISHIICRYCSGLLRDALLYWEYWAFNSNENRPGFSQKFKQLMVTYKVRLKLSHVGDDITHIWWTDDIHKQWPSGLMTIDWMLSYAYSDCVPKI